MWNSITFNFCFYIMNRKYLFKIPHIFAKSLLPDDEIHKKFRGKIFSNDNQN